MATQLHPIVRAHPETGRPGLFGCIGYVIGIDGMADDEARQLIPSGTHGRRRSFWYRHRWAAGDARDVGQPLGAPPRHRRLRGLRPSAPSHHHRRPLIPERGSPAVEVALLGDARRQPSGRARTRPAPPRPSGQLEQVGAHRVQPVVAPHLPVRSNGSSIARPASGPSTIATATAWLSVTTGPGASSLEHRVEHLDLGPVGVLGAARPRRGRRRSRPAAGTARPARPAARPRPARCPRGSAPRSHRVRSCSVERDERAVAATRAARRASVSSISASSPADLAGSRQPLVQPPGQPDRLVGQRRRRPARPRSCWCGPR